MGFYIYQDWNKPYREIQSEEDTLWYYKDLYKTPNPDWGDLAVQKAAKEFLKTCESTEDWARYAYSHNLQFCICKTDAHLVESYIKQDIIKDITVFFLDEYNRVFMYYVFRKQSNERYFCIGMKFWEFIDGFKGTDDYSTAWTYVFEPTGNVQVIEREKDADEECVWTSKKPLNVESNWEDRPEFGDWDGFFVMKRWQEGELDEALGGEKQKKYIYKDGTRYYKDEDGNLIEDN